MKYGMVLKMVMIAKGVLTFGVLLHFGASAQAQHIWGNLSGVDRLWEDAENWEDDNLPFNPALQEVRFSLSISGTSRTVNLGSDQMVNAGLLVNTSSSNTARFFFNLGGNTLTISGSNLLFSHGSNGSSGTPLATTFENGTVQLGTAGAGNAASLIINRTGSYGGGDNPIITRFLPGSTLNTFNTTSIEVAANNANYGHRFTLDLSAATLVSGAEANTLKVNEDIQAGVLVGGNTRAYKSGLIQLGVVEHVNIGQDLILGQSGRTAEGVAYATGELQFATQSQAANLTIGRDLRLGVGANATGTITNQPDSLNVAIGTDTMRGGVLYVGYKNLTVVDSDPVSSTGNFVTKGGVFSAYITELRVGQNNDSANAGQATGTLDFSASTLTTLDISGDAIIGQGQDAEGILRLSGGEARSSTLLVGHGVTGTRGARSELSLNGTSWVVEDALLVGSLGDIHITLASGGLGGLDLGSDASLAFDLTSIAAGGKITVVFAEDTPAWGIRAEGNKLAVFEQYLNNGGFVAIGDFGNLVSVWTEGGYTYYGVIPEPASAVLGMAILILAAGGWIRTRKTVR